jgi:hypothetical protein
VVARASVLLAAVAMAVPLSTALASARTAARKPSVPRPPPAPVVVPPDLVALSQRMQALHVSSERFQVRLTIAVSRSTLPRGAQGPPAGFAFDISGEVQNAPPAASLKVSAFGHTGRLRVAAGSAYVYEPSIAKFDHGRPWVDLGPGAAKAPLGGPGGALASGAGVTSFKALVSALAGARSIVELGPSIVDGQAVTGFRATVAASALEEPSTPVNTKPRGVFAPVGVGASAKEPPGAAQLELFIAPSGLPVRTRIRQREEGATVTALDDIYAVDFPLVVEPPPKSQTIAEAALRVLEQKRHAKRSPARHREREDHSG